MTSATTSTMVRHPIRGGVYGFVLGLGLALMAIGRKIVDLDSVIPVILVVLGIGIGVAWAMFAPAKGRTAPAGAPDGATSSD